MLKPAHLFGAARTLIFQPAASFARIFYSGKPHAENIRICRLKNKKLISPEERASPSVKEPDKFIIPSPLFI
jgi:hypothetical protein